jgi:hypothetical protein
MLVKEALARYLALDGGRLDEDFSASIPGIGLIE